MNKEDYKGIIIPVQSHKQEFTPLTETEINLLANDQYADYKTKLDECNLQEAMNAEIFQETWSEDSHTSDDDEY